MGSSFERTDDIENEREERMRTEVLSRTETVSDLGEKITHLSVAAQMQPDMLRMHGKDLGLTPLSVDQVFSEKEYPDRLQLLRDRIRQAAEAVAVMAALALPVAGQAETGESTEKVSEGAVPEFVYSQPETSLTDIHISDNVVRIDVTAAERATLSTLTFPENIEEIVETPPKNEGQLKKEGQAVTPEQKELSEKLRQLSDERMKLFMDLTSTVLTEGASSPLSMKKLLLFVGKVADDRKMNIAEEVAAKVVPYFDGMKALLEAMQGETFGEEKIEKRELKGLDRLKRFGKGIITLAMDMSQIGAIGRIVHKMSLTVAAAESIERAVECRRILVEMEEHIDTINLENLEKMVEGVFRGGRVQKVRGDIESMTRETLVNTITALAGREGV